MRASIILAGLFATVSFAIPSALQSCKNVDQDCIHGDPLDKTSCCTGLYCADDNVSRQSTGRPCNANASI